MMKIFFMWMFCYINVGKNFSNNRSTIESIKSIIIPYQIPIINLSINHLLCNWKS